MKLQGRKIDNFGNVIFDRDGLIDILMSGDDIKNLISDNEDETILKYNYWCEYFDDANNKQRLYETPSLPIELFDSINQSEWFMPDEYKTLDVLSWLEDKCKTNKELDRVYLEWEMFKERNMENVLRFLIYLISHFREKNIVWGVGRGSSVASYCLYLIGVHKINSIEYELDPTEFLK